MKSRPAQDLFQNTSLYALEGAASALMARNLRKALNPSQASISAATTRKKPTIPIRVFPTSASPFTAPERTFARQIVRGEDQGGNRRDEHEDHGIKGKCR